MHRKGIIHRDLKPDNILILDKKEMKVCISDLGLACRANDPVEVESKCGTPGYVAPEILKGQRYTIKADIFSLGSFMFNLLTGKNLFPGRNGKEILVSNKYSNPATTVHMHVTGVSTECKNLLGQMVKVSPD